MNINLYWATALLVAAAIPASAGERADRAISTAHDMARIGVGQVGRVVGNEMCGPPCGFAVKSGAQRAFDLPQRLAPRIQQFGREQIRPRLGR